MRAAGFVVDGIQVESGGNHTLAEKRNRVQAFIINRSFGVRGHTFQYLWATGHVPRPEEPWPQRTSAPLTRR